MSLLAPQSLQKNARQRPNAAELLAHPLIEGVKAGAECLVAEVARTRDWLAQQRTGAAAAEAAAGQTLVCACEQACATSAQRWRSDCGAMFATPPFIGTAGAAGASARGCTDRGGERE